MKNRSLLDEYVTEKEGTYIEPERKGTAKGEEIGFSFVKYQSTLYALTSSSSKDIATHLGLSYGLLRVWRTEESYLRMIKGHVADFSFLFVNNILHTINKARIDDASYMIEAQHHEKLYADWQDIWIYSDDLLECIYRQAMAVIFNNLLREKLFMQLLSNAFFIRKYVIDRDKDKEEGKYIPRLMARQMNYSILYSLDAFQRPWTPLLNPKILEGDKQCR